MGQMAAPGSSSYFSTFLLKMAKRGTGNILGSLIFIFFWEEAGTEDGSLFEAICCNI